MKVGVFLMKNVNNLRIALTEDILHEIDICATDGKTHKAYTITDDDKIEYVCDLQDKHVKQYMLGKGNGIKVMNTNMLNTIKNDPERCKQYCQDYRKFKKTK